MADETTPPRRAVAPQPRPVEVGEKGPELISKVSTDGHKHRYQRFRILSESSNPSKPNFEERCPGCGKKKGSRD